MNLNDKTATIIDSLNGELAVVKNFRKTLEKKRFTVTMEIDGTQQDGVSCGVFAAYNVIQLLTNQNRVKIPPVSFFRQVQESMNKWRTPKDIQLYYKAKGSLSKTYSRIISGESPPPIGIRSVNKNVLDITYFND
jgi:hypothetical protein